MKAILVIDLDKIDMEIEKTQATFIELQCNNQIEQISLINHWLKPLPQWLYYSDDDKRYVDGWDDCLNEILGE